MRLVARLLMLNAVRYGHGGESGTEQQGGDAGHQLQESGRRWRQTTGRPAERD